MRRERAPRRRHADAFCYERGTPVTLPSLRSSWRGTRRVWVSGLITWSCGPQSRTVKNGTWRRESAACGASGRPVGDTLIVAVDGMPEEGSEEASGPREPLSGEAL